MTLSATDRRFGQWTLRHQTFLFIARVAAYLLVGAMVQQGVGFWAVPLVIVPTLLLAVADGVRIGAALPEEGVG